MSCSPNLLVRGTESAPTPEALVVDAVAGIPGERFMVRAGAWEALPGRRRPRRHLVPARAQRLTPAPVSGAHNAVEQPACCDRRPGSVTASIPDGQGGTKSRTCNGLGQFGGADRNGIVGCMTDGNDFHQPRHGRSFLSPLPYTGARSIPGRFIRREPCDTHRKAFWHLWPS